MTISRIRILMIPSRNKLPMDLSELCEMGTKRLDSSRVRTAWLSKWYVTSLGSTPWLRLCEDVYLCRSPENKTSRMGLVRGVQRH